MELQPPVQPALEFVLQLSKPPNLVGMELLDTILTSLHYFECIEYHYWNNPPDAVALRLSIEHFASLLQRQFPSKFQELKTAWWPLQTALLSLGKTHTQHPAYGLVHHIVSQAAGLNEESLTLLIHAFKAAYIVVVDKDNVQTRRLQARLIQDLKVNRSPTPHVLFSVGHGFDDAGVVEGGGGGLGVEEGAHDGREGHFVVCGVEGRGVDAEEDGGGFGGGAGGGCGEFGGSGEGEVGFEGDVVSRTCDLPGQPPELLIEGPKAERPATEISWEKGDTVPNTPVADSPVAGGHVTEDPVGGSPVAERPGLSGGK
ncbi:hypothetical protein PMIN01_08060 [Paraphaeosphaeria minitans]|uniref:Uncharacterized protein n=1 Tax=Paraphaeosphaeria minitans TaxID=565426 RepID=A0A9P6KP49_9PLEO|nr:hypothetical protein PMIN01_08060 [Paraphaeosphaeria minitans]